MISIYCKNLQSHCGVLADVEPLGVVSDASWKCSGTKTLGWAQPGFDDSQWPQATELNINGEGVWGPKLLGKISSRAYWIWTQTTSSLNAYCRYNLGTL